MKKIVVVGDKLHDFTNGKEVITMSELELLTLLPDNKIILGQGVNSDSINKIISTHRKNVDYCNNLEIDSLKEFVKNKKNINCHKQRNENILIGRSKAIEQSNKYVMSLVIDERCELMVDHQTGQHIRTRALL
jgi:metallophosphoesterase superfamily enzyme